jgi:hypothetical protein
MDGEMQQDATLLDGLLELEVKKKLGVVHTWYEMSTEI